MDIVLTHFTALEALRSPSLRWRLLKGERRAADPPARPPTKEELAAIVPRLPGHVRGIEPLEVLVAHDAPRSRPLHVRAHRALESLPADSAVQIAPGVRCVSPEHLVVQLAPLLTELELICLLSELLGTYAIAEEVEGGMFSRRQPLTTPELVERHLDALGPVRGTAKVRRALRHACVGSASPRETKLSLRLGLKKARGGYGLEVLSMNDPLTVRRVHDAMRKGVRRPDVLLLAPGGIGENGRTFRGVAVEYDGRDHDGFEQHTRDVARHNELAAIGLVEYVVTRQQYDDLDYMDGLAEIIGRELGIPKVRVKRSVAEERRRGELCRELNAIDGIHWRCLACEEESGPTEGERGDVVPVEAYGLE